MCEPDETGFLSLEAENTLTDKRHPRWRWQEITRKEMENRVLLLKSREENSIWKDKHKRYPM